MAVLKLLQKQTYRMPCATSARSVENKPRFRVERRFRNSGILLSSSWTVATISESIWMDSRKCDLKIIISVDEDVDVIYVMLYTISANWANDLSLWARDTSNSPEHIYYVRSSDIPTSPNIILQHEVEYSQTLTWHTVVIAKLLAGHTLWQLEHVGNIKCLQRGSVSTPSSALIGSEPYDIPVSGGLLSKLSSSLSRCRCFELPS